MKTLLKTAVSVLMPCLIAACGGGSGEAPGGSASSTTDTATGTGREVMLSAPLVGQRWSDPATWGGTVPAAGAVVVIPVGKTVMLDVATPLLKGLTVQGTLVAQPAATVAITSDYVMVRGGRLQIGTAAEPFLGQATITLTGQGTGDLPGTAGFGSKVLGVMGGTLEMHGSSVPKSWTSLGADAAVGDKGIVLAVAPNWQAGDRIAIATSSPDQNEYDVATVQSVSGKTVTLAEALKYKHMGTVRRVGTIDVDVRAEVALLSRNIVVQGDDEAAASNEGGHAMFMAGSGVTTVQLSQVEFRRMGQLNRAGRYPMHFHEMAGSCAKCYVKDSSVHDTLQRGIVVHGSSGITLAGNVVFNTVGHNVVIEDEDTTGNLLDGNLAFVNRQPKPLHTEPTLVGQEDRMPSNYWIKAARNTLTGNHAAGSFFNGFNYPSVDQSEDDDKIGQPIDFRNNTVHAAMGIEGAGAGDFDITGGLLISSAARRPAGERIEGVLSYHNNVGIWFEGGGLLKLQRFTVVENRLDIESRGVGTPAAFIDGLFVGTLPGSTRSANGTQMHHQYGSDTTVDNVTFANYETLGFAGTDTGPTQSSWKFSNVHFIGTRPPGGAPADDSVFELLDDTLLPRGVYIDAMAPWLAMPACGKVLIGNPTEPSLSFRCPQRPHFVELETRDRLNSTFNDKTNPMLKRSDGLRYHRPTSDAEVAAGLGGLGSGMHSTSVLYNEAGLSYAVEGTPGSTVAVRLSDAAIPTATADLVADTASLALALPVADAPRAVYRTGIGFDAPDAPTAANALRAAASMAEHRGDPTRTYFYDAVARQLWVQAGRRWVIVAP